MSWKNLFRRKHTEESLISNSIAEYPDETGTALEKTTQRTENHDRILAAKLQHQEGKIAEAESVYQDVLKDDPENAEAWHLMGVVCLQRGQLPEAEQNLRRAIGLDNQKAPYYSNLGNVLGAQNRTEEAHHCFNKALDLDANNLPALSNLATALLSMGREGEAKKICIKILEISPQDTSARLNLAVALIAEHQALDALDVLQEALAIEPYDTQLLTQMASTLELVNRLDEALATIELIEEINPGIARILMLKGLIARRKGDPKEAEKQLEAAINGGLSDTDTIEAFNQLGLSLEAMGSEIAAFEAFERSNKAMSQFVGKENANGASYLHEIAEVRDFFNQKTTELLGRKFATEEDFSPVFFVGFPRSGTTLLEQALKAHPEIVTTDELSPLAAVIREIRKIPGGYPRGLQNMSSEDLIRLRRHFFEFTQHNICALEGKQLVDKLPLNIVHLSLAKLLFPKSKFLVALRDPRDACLSCFMQKFEINSAMANFLELDTTGLAYDAVMGLWLEHRAELQDSWLEYRYENLVDNFDGTVSKILDFIGVGWHDDISDYRQAAQQRVITTPSYRDVVAPVNDRALARWRRYETNLTPILPVLAPYIEAFGYEPSKT